MFLPAALAVAAQACAMWNSVNVPHRLINALAPKKRLIKSRPAADQISPCLQTLSPLQEAWLEANSHPWCPDIWCVTFF